MANEKFKINGVVSEVVPIVGTTGDILKKTVSGVKWESLVKATTTTNGLMSSADKTKLDGIETGAQKNIMTSADKTKLDGIETGAQKNIMTSADKTKLNGIEAGAQKNTVTSVAGKTGAVTITKSDVGLGSVNNVAITQAQVTKINELNYTRALTQAQYDALSTAEKNRTDVWYGIYK